MCVRSLPRESCVYTKFPSVSRLLLGASVGIRLIRILELRKGLLQCGLG